MPAYLGEFEQLVLLAILRLGDEASGAAIREAVEDGCGRTVWIGAVHTTLDRAIAKGLVNAQTVPSRAAGGRRRKIYELEPAGREALRHAYATWARMTRGLKPKLEAK
jgi:DNA-binding PadR family transcriptional regulator